MSIISIINNKGGVGKTTTTFQLGAYLASQGRRVLLIDFDGQTSLTEKVGSNLDTQNYDVVDFLQSSTKNLKDAQFFINEDGMLYSLKGTKEINVLLNVNKQQDPDQWNLLRNSLRKHRAILNQMWDFVLIDCPPQMIMDEFLTPSEVALFASDYVLVPCCADKDSISGFNKVMKSFAQIKKENTTLKMLGMVFTLVQHREVVYQQYRTVMEDVCKGGVFKTSIRRSAEMSQALNLNQPIFSYKKESNPAKDYTDLAEELLSKIATFEK